MLIDVRCYECLAKKGSGKGKKLFFYFLFFVDTSLKNRIVLYSWLKKFTGISFQMGESVIFLKVRFLLGFIL